MKSTETWKTYSVFVSSTFKDMHAEREHLNNIVLKEVEEEIRKYKIHLNIVDLRWGVNVKETDGEAEREKHIIKVCLSEIKRCKPFFIGLIGNRYGWQPGELAMKASIQSSGEGLRKYKDIGTKSVTALEIEYGVLKDPNQISGSIFCFRNIKKVPAERLCNFYDDHDDELKNQQKVNKQLYLEKLKRDIRSFYRKSGNAKKHQILNYDLAWNEDENKLNLGIKEWGDKVRKALMAEIMRFVKESQLPQTTGWADIERGYFNDFVERHTRSINLSKERKISLFTGRSNTINSLIRKINNENYPAKGIIINGESGLGKSAILAKIYKIFEAKNQEDILLLGHAANISAESSKISTMLKLWIYALLKSKKSKSSEEIKLIKSIESDSVLISEQDELDFLENKFIELLLDLAKKNQKIVLFIDAIDYLENSDCVNYFTWLPVDMPENVRIICTSVETDRFKYENYHKSLFEIFELPAFEEKDAEKVFLKLCRLHHKQIPAKTIDLVLHREKDGRRGISSPLWLNLCVNLLLAIDSDDFENLTQKNVSGKNMTLEMYEFIDDLISHFPVWPNLLFIDLVEKAKKIFNKSLVDGVLNYISASRYGLREKDLENLLGKDWDNLRFASFRRWFNQFIILTGQDRKWDFSHSLLKNKIIEINNLLNLNKELHSDLAKYLFKNTPEEDILYISETMFHLHKSGKRELSAHFLSKFSGIILINAVNYIYEEVKKSDESLEWVLSLLDFEKINSPVESYESLDLTKDYYHQLCNRYFNLIARDFLEKGEIEKGESILETTYDKFGKYTANNQVNFSVSLGELNQLCGYFKYKLNDFEKADGYYLKSLDFFRMKSDMENKLGEINTLINLSDLYAIQKLYKEAVGYIDEGRRVFNSMQNDFPISDLSIVESQLLERKGNVFMDLGMFDDALSKFQEGFDILNNQITENDIKAMPGEKSDLLRALVISFNNMANVTISRIDKYKTINPDAILKAKEYLAKSQSVSEKQFRKYPYNLTFKLDIANTLSSLSYLCLLEKNYIDSIKYSLKNIEILQQLRAFDRRNSEYLINLSKAYLNLANIFYFSCDYRKAKKYFNKCIINSSGYDERYFPELTALISESEQMLNKIRYF